MTGTSQLTIITTKLGKLPEEDLDFVTSEKALRLMRKLPSKPVVPLAQQFPSASPECLDLLARMLRINLWKRITVAEALQHPSWRRCTTRRTSPCASARSTSVSRTRSCTASD